MTTLSTHVLDTAAGQPARGVRVLLEPRMGQAWQLAKVVTPGDDGRVDGFGDLEPGYYRLTFDAAGYFAETAFFPEIIVSFDLRGDEHHHVPLLMSPFSYTTYRGS